MPMRGKRKRSTLATAHAIPEVHPIPPLDGLKLPPPKRRATSKKSQDAVTNPDVNIDVLDGVQALRASPDADRSDEKFKVGKRRVRQRAGVLELEDTPSSLVSDEDTASLLTEQDELEPPASKTKKGAGKKSYARPEAAKTAGTVKHPVGKEAKVAADPEDPEADGLEAAPEEEVKEALVRPPPVNSDYLPLPWKGRLGYACLNTYLLSSNPPVFSSRTCRIQSILDHRHPLTDPNAPEHPTKNRPDKTKPADIARGQKYVEELGLANAQDIGKMVRWNDKYGIKFMRLSSEMFPFASHEEYGYKLASFAAGTLAEAGRVAAELGHRLTTHPGQYTQLGSPRKQVIDNAIRDLGYHAEMLDLLKLPPQQDRDAVMILHLGGVFGDKGETLDRFRANYARLAPNIKKRLVLENDDVSWSVHDLLPVCEELNIPLVLDFHHHNIIFDKDKIREGTKDIIDLFPRIRKTWERKGITPKMHYSEPTPAAITGHQRRKHSPRVATMPPCPPDTDLMIEAKDKEQAVFELMRAFKLPGFDKLNNIVPHARSDEFKAAKPFTKKEDKDRAKAEERGEALEVREDYNVPREEVGMGGPEGRVYWPPGMEEWLRPVKRPVAKKEDGEPTPKKKNKAAAVKAEENADGEAPSTAPNTNGVPKAAAAKIPAKAKPKKAAPVKEETEIDSGDLSDLPAKVAKPASRQVASKAATARPGRMTSKRVSYAEVEDMDE